MNMDVIGMRNGHIRTGIDKDMDLESSIERD